MFSLPQDSALQPYLQSDHQLVKLLFFGSTIYAPKDELYAHNFEHGLWVGDKAVRIMEKEDVPPESYRSVIAASVLHDWGTGALWKNAKVLADSDISDKVRNNYFREYHHHPCYGQFLAQQHLKRFGFTEEEMEHVVTIIEEHDLRTPTSLESEVVIDADTLNKAGSHGIMQCLLVAGEFGLGLKKVATRFKKLYATLLDEGYQTETARDMDYYMGKGLEEAATFWVRAEDLLQDTSERRVLAIIKDSLETKGQWTPPPSSPNFLLTSTSGA